MIDAAEVIVDLLARGHWVRFEARGDSMHPVILSGDYLHVEPADPSKLARGEVVLTLADRGLTAHRIVAREGDTVVTRGDNAPSPDAALPLSRVIGRVVWVERDGKRHGVERRFRLRSVLRRLSS